MKIKDTFTGIWKDYSPKCDPWGTAINAMFDVAGEMYNRGLSIPHSWNYSPGLGAPKIEAEYLREMIEALDDETLVKLGNFLHRLTNWLEHAGKSY